MEYETVIGLEVHAQLLTKSKMFCSCGAEYQEAPANTMVCPVCMGMPGVLPVINRRAVEHVIRTGLALECTVARQTKFDRKNYPYPDLMKGYQISQYDQPIAANGRLVIATDAGEKAIGIIRVHLEEDVARLLHRSDATGEGYTLVDVNRAGAPLMEVVSAPEIANAEEARAYLTTLRSLLRYVGASAANMEEGSFRCDANISLRPRGAKELGVKVEVKNMNSFRSVFRALKYEEERQAQVMLEGGRISQETRGWVEDRGVTVSQRSKEYASDYRYFPEPDLPPVHISPEWVAEIRAGLPELPHERKARFARQYGLSAYDAGLLTSNKATADFFEEVVAARPTRGHDGAELAKAAGNWVLGDLSRLLNLTGMDVGEVRFTPTHLAELIGLVDAGTLSITMARTVFEEMFETGQAPGQIAERSGMVQISDSDAIAGAVAGVLAANARPVADYLGGKETALRFLVGQVMKATGGKANPQLVAEVLQRKLQAMR